MKELVPYVSCLCEPEELDEVVKGSFSEIYIPILGGGYLKHVKLSGGRHVRIKVEKLPVTTTSANTVTIDEELNFLPAGKIPYEFFEQIVEFFRQVSKKMKAEFEAHAWILWTKELGYFISVPKQSVSKASVKFTYDDESLPPGSVIVCDIHSHNTMGAFYSGTDDNNDKSGIYYSAVIGKLTATAFEYVIRFNLYEQKKKCDLSEVFEVPVKNIVVNPEWLAKVDNAPQYTSQAMTSVVPHNRRASRLTEVPSLWDQRNNSAQGDMPFGFKEIDLPKGKGGNKHTKGKGNTEDRITDLGDWVDGDGNIFVPGPNEEYEAMMARMAKAAHQDIEELGIGIDPDEGGEVEEVAGKYGKEAGESYELITDFLVNLEECDEPLQEIINTCFAMMTSEGQRKLQTDGLQ